MQGVADVGIAKQVPVTPKEDVLGAAKIVQQLSMQAPVTPKEREVAESSSIVQQLLASSREPSCEEVLGAAKIDSVSKLILMSTKETALQTEEAAPKKARPPQKPSPAKARPSQKPSPECLREVGCINSLEPEVSVSDSEQPARETTSSRYSGKSW